MNKKIKQKSINKKLYESLPILINDKIFHHHQPYLQIKPFIIAYLYQTKSFRSFIFLTYAIISINQDILIQSNILISTSMNQSSSSTNIFTSQTYSSITQRQQQIRELILNSKDIQIIKQYNQILQEKIQIQMRGLNDELIVFTKGRGGNNIAENIKKSIISIIKKKLPSHIYSQFQKESIQKHQLKSQKENVIIFFLYLHKYQMDGMIEYTLIEEIYGMMKGKIMKYIDNSKDKLKLEVERREFHEKNIVQFQKFLRIDLKFNEIRSFASIAHQLQSFYIRKKVQFNKAIHRLTKIIESQPFFKTLFHDLSPDVIKQEQISQTKTQKRDHNQTDSLSND